MRCAVIGLLAGLLLSVCVCAEQPASVATIAAKDLVEYRKLPRKMRKLVDASLELTRKDLRYTFGSASPEKGGMDCSGTIHHLLKAFGVADVPRSSHTIFKWADSHGKLVRFRGVHDPAHAVFRKLKPGDLVFWEGTYATKDRDPPISHVMIFLGTLKEDGRGATSQ